MVAVSATASADDPRILIVVKPQPKDATPIPMADYFAQQLDDDGVVFPIVWGLTDPVFREAATSGVIKDFSEHPSAAEAQAIARKLRAEFVATIEISVKAKTILGKISVTKDGKQVFKADENFGVDKAGQLDTVASGKSISRTWASKLGFSAFKGLPKHTKVTTPEASPGQIVPISAPSEPVVDNKMLLVEVDRVKKATAAQVERLKREAADANRFPVISPEDLAREIVALEKGRDESIVSIYRDAVDAEPLNIERRRFLIEALQGIDDRLAANEARRAAQLMPEQIELRVIAARSWMRVPDEAEAQVDLNEAISRDPDAVPIRLLLCEVCLGKLDADAALEHADRAVKRESTAATRFMRALCRALLGGLDGVKSDVAAMGAPATPEQRALTAKLLDRSLDESISTMKSLVQRAAVKKTDDVVRDGIDQLQRTLASRLEILAAVTPVTERALFDKLSLAYKLLSQSVIDLRGYVAGEDDALGECRINLAEAVRRLKASRG